MLKPKGHFRAFHYDTPLLFQFIYIEYISSQKELIPLLKKKTAPEVMIATLTKLTGATNDYMRLFNWNHHDGILTKLKNNCSYFLQNSPVSQNDSSLFQSYADQAWLSTAECLHKLNQCGSMDKELLEQASSHLNLMGEKLKQMIVYFKEDENVLLFILRHQESLNELYGASFVRNYFEKIYPEGLRSVSKFLIERYTERGFMHLIPMIEKTCRT